MKLYIWEHVLGGHESSGMMFAIAESLEAAKEQISPGYNSRIGKIIKKEEDHPGGYKGMELDRELAEGNPKVMDVMPMAYVWDNGPV
jgi:hypothetical protein